MDIVQYQAAILLTHSCKNVWHRFWIRLSATAACMKAVLQGDGWDGSVHWFHNGKDDLNRTQHFEKYEKEAVAWDSDKEQKGGARSV